jgi:glucosamine-6-phosphate deaminase
MKQRAPHIEIVGNAGAVSDRAAAHVIARLRDRNPVTLGFATGATMKPVYARLAAATRAGEISFRAVSSFNLDEYVGVTPQSPGSFHAYMQQHLFAHVDMVPGKARIPDGMAPDIAAEAARYEAQIAASGGVDLLLLGMGTNGHIAFNEPGSDFSSRTREIRLDQATRIASAGDFPHPTSVPERAITIGIATILEARSILLIAAGTAKATALAAAVEGPIGPACPASALRLHDNVHIICDEAAAAALINRPHNGKRRTA